MKNYKLTLASGSPRRYEILKGVGYDFEVIKPCSDEIGDGVPEDVVLYNANSKADAAKKMTDGVIICADTVVALGDRILGKPKTPERAYEMLRSLSGNTHRVLTGFVVTDGEKSVEGVEIATVTMRRLHDDEINAYIASGSPLDKAGAYGIQDFGGLFVTKIDGDYYNVMGLPLCRIADILRTEFDILPF